MKNKEKSGVFLTSEILSIEIGVLKTCRFTSSGNNFSVVFASIFVYKCQGS